MNELANQIVIRLAVASAFLTGGALLASTLLAVFRCKLPRVHTMSWCLVLAQTLLVFQIPIALPWNGFHVGKDADSPSTFDVLAEDLSTVAFTEVSAENALSTDAISDKQPSNRATLLLLAWSTGCLLLLLQWLMRYVSFIRSVSCKECDVVDWNQEWEEVLADSAISHRPSLHVSRNVGPLLCRWPHEYRLLVPLSFWRTIPSKQRQAILRHELAHFERHDIPKALAATLLAAMHWFNPCAWVAVRRLEDSIEWMCDDIVRRSRWGGTQYAKALLAIGQYSAGQEILASSIRGGSLSARIRRVIAKEPAPDSRLKIGFALSLLVGLSMVHVIRIDSSAQEPSAQVQKTNATLVHGEVSDQLVTKLNECMEKCYSTTGRIGEQFNVLTERAQIARVADLIYLKLRRGDDSVNQLLGKYAVQDLEVPPPASVEMTLEELLKLRSRQQDFMQQLFERLGNRNTRFAEELQGESTSSFKPQWELTKHKLHESKDEATASLQFAGGRNFTVRFKLVGKEWLFDGKASEEIYELRPTGILEVNLAFSPVVLRDLMLTGKVDEAITRLDEQLAKEPENPLWQQLNTTLSIQLIASQRELAMKRLNSQFELLIAKEPLSLDSVVILATSARYLATASDESPFEERLAILNKAIDKVPIIRRDATAQAFIETSSALRELLTVKAQLLIKNGRADGAKQAFDEILGRYRACIDSAEQHTLRAFNSIASAYGLCLAKVFPQDAQAVLKEAESLAVDPVSDKKP